MQLVKISPEREIIFRGSLNTVEHQIKEMGLTKNSKKTIFNKNDPYNFINDIYFTKGKDVYIVFNGDDDMNINRIADRLDVSTETKSTTSKIRNFFTKK
jgi:hypothetical protein